MSKDYGKYEMNKTEYILFIFVYIASSLLVSLLFYRNIFFAPVTIPFFKRIKEYYADYQLERRKKKLLSEFKDFLFMISTSIGAGRSMKDAINESIPSLERIYGETSLLAPEMRDIYHRMEGSNEKDSDVLLDFAMRTGMEDVIDFVNIYSTCKSTGASLILALNKAASVIIDKMSIDNEIKELVKRKEYEGMVIFVMPVVVIIFMNLLARDYIDPLYMTFSGRVVMTVVIAANIFVYKIIRNITKIEI